MIQKILHTCFFGDWPWTPLNLRCHASWAKHLPDYHVMHWTRHNLPPELEDSAWMREALLPLKQGKRLSGSQLNFMGYLRDWLLFNYGGIWVDNDVEFLRPPDLNQQAFVGWQTDKPELISVNCAVMGSMPHHWFPKACMNRLLSLEPACPPTQIGPDLITATLRDAGLKMNAEEQDVNGVRVYPKEVLYPWAWFEEPSRAKLTDRTVAIHWWEGSWAPEHMRRPSAWSDFTSS